MSFCVEPSPALACHLCSLCAWTVPRTWVQRGFGSQICHFSEAQQRKSSNLQAQPGLPVFPSNLLLPNCSDLLVSQPRLGDAVARQCDKAGNPYTCWSNCKSVETSITSILFPKRNVLWKTALLPSCNLFRSLMHAGVEAMPTETQLMLNICSTDLVFEICPG